MGGNTQYPRLNSNSEHGEHTEGIECFGHRRKDRKEIEKRATAAQLVINPINADLRPTPARCAGSRKHEFRLCSSWCSPVVTHVNTLQPVWNFSLAERTGCRFLLSLWPYVQQRLLKSFMIKKGENGCDLKDLTLVLYRS